MRLAVVASHRRSAVLLGLALCIGAFLLTSAGDARAAKLCCGVIPPESQVSEGTQGEQFNGIGGVAVNIEGKGPGATPGDIYVVDRVNNRIQQFHEIADAEGHRFVRAFGLNVGGPGVNVCTVAALCQAGTASGVAGAMNEPMGVAVDQETGNLFITDNKNHRIGVFSADGTFQGAFGWKVNASAPLEELQFCTTASGCQEGSPGASAGQFPERTVNPGSQNLPVRGLGYPAIAPPGAPNAGNVVVADSNNNRIDEFSITLNVGKEVTGVNFIRGIGWNVNLTTPLEALQMCTLASDCKKGSPGNNLGQFTERGLMRVAVDATGAIYTVNLPDSGSFCNNTLTGAASRRCRVQKLNAAAVATDFAPIQLNGIGAPSRNATTDITVDPGSGDLYAARPFNDPTKGQVQYQVLRFDSAGNLLDTNPAEGVLPPFGLTVFGMALNPNSGRVYLSSSTGGQRVYLLTEPPSMPPKAATGATSAGANFALRTLEGAVNPEGFRVLGCRFEYGMTTKYGSSTPCDPAPSEIGEGTGDVAVSAETEPLEPNATYYYRLVAENGGPIGKGANATFTTSPAPADGCPNTGRRKEQGIAALALPSCMALEMVSSPKKGGQPARFPRISADGNRISFVSAASLGNAPGVLGVGGNTYVSSRESAGWGVESTVPPQPIAKLWASENAPSFTPDFSRWFQIGATAAQAQVGIGQVFEGGVGGVFAPLSNPMVPLTPGIEPVVIGSTFQGASADHSHLYFQSGTSIPNGFQASTYLSGDPELSGSGAEKNNTYLARRSASEQLFFELLERDREGKVWGGNCGARLGGLRPAEGTSVPNGERNQGAISTDGTRTYFSARVSQPATGPCETTSKLRILERLETRGGTTIAQLYVSECSRTGAEPCSGVDGDDLYQGASVDQTKVYFTTNRQLANSDLDGSSDECKAEVAVAGCDLYLYDRSRPAGQRLVQVSAGEELGATHEKGKEAGVFNGITAISGDGSHVYFVAQGVLTDEENPEHTSAQAGKFNFYLWDIETESTSFLGVLNSGDVIKSNRGKGLWGGQGTWRNNAYPVPVTRKDSKGREVGGDGHILLFQSKAELTGQDADGAHLDVYRYDADASPPTLICISCRPGGPDSELVDVDDHGEQRPGGTDFAEEGRWVSEDGQTVGFLTPEDLVPGDVNGDQSFYLWREGDLSRLPGIPFVSERTNGPFLSHDGSTVAFMTASQLLSEDGDTVADVYVARVGGGFPTPIVEDSCQLNESAAKRCQETEMTPSLPSAATSTFVGTGNPKSASRCPKGKTRRNGHCVSRNSRKKRAKKARPTHEATVNRRAAK